MISIGPTLFQAARIFTFSSAVSVLFSIAVSQILLALAVVTLLLSGAKLRLPRIWLPLAVFLLGTLVSLALSADPSSGLPQVRKIFVFLMLLVVFSTLADLVLVRRLVLFWAGFGALVATRGLVQFLNKWQEARAAGRSFYEYYVGERITGFMSHWMTFGGQEMIVLLMLASFLLFAPQPGKRGRWFWLLSGVILSAALILGFTRSIWLATGVAGLYLVWQSRRWWILIAPTVALAILVIAPTTVRDRFSSLLQPRRDVDSNMHRVITWRTGLRMIQAHPWFGLGPEQVKVQFYDYLPSDIPKPLPPGWYGHLHNIYLHYAAERGIATMLALVWLLVTAIWDFLRALRRLPAGPSNAKFLLHAGVAIVAAVMISGIFELNLGDSEVLMMFLVVAGFGYIAAEQASGERTADA